MSTAPEYRPSVADRIGIWTFMVVGIAIVAWSAFAALSRVMQVLLGEDVPVLASFIDTRAEAPIGPDGALVPVTLDTAYVVAEQLPAASVVAALIEPAIAFLTVAIVVVCLILLARNILRGRIFSKGNTALVATAGFTGFIGSALAPFFGNMVANGAIARISNRTFERTAVLSIEPFPYIILAFALGIAVTAFGVGDRLRRETEGLV